MRRGPCWKTCAAWRSSVTSRRCGSRRTVATATILGGDLTSLLHNSVLFGPPRGQARSSAKDIFFYENPLAGGDLVAARASLDNMRNVAAARDETALWKTWTYAALGLMDDLASNDP